MIICLKGSRALAYSECVKPIFKAMLRYTVRIAGSASDLERLYPENRCEPCKIVLLSESNQTV